MSEADPQSPCVSICRLDAQNICVGCFRSADEITDWLLVGAEQKREILRRASQRHEASNSSRRR